MFYQYPYLDVEVVKQTVDADLSEKQPVVLHKQQSVDPKGGQKLETWGRLLIGPIGPGVKGIVVVPGVKGIVPGVRGIVVVHHFDFDFDLQQRTCYYDLFQS